MDNISVITLIDLEHEKLFNKYTNEIKTTIYVVSISLKKVYILFKIMES